MLPRAFASFTVVSKYVKSKVNSNTVFCCQLSNKLQNHQLLKEKQVPSRTALRKYQTNDILVLFQYLLIGFFEKKVSFTVDIMLIPLSPGTFFPIKKGGELVWYRDIWYFPLKPVFGLTSKSAKKGGGGINVISRYLVFSLKTGFWPRAKIG